MTLLSFLGVFSLSLQVCILLWCEVPYSILVFFGLPCALLSSVPFISIVHILGCLLTLSEVCLETVFECCLSLLFIVSFVHVSNPDNIVGFITDCSNYRPTSILLLLRLFSLTIAVLMIATTFPFFIISFIYSL